jgi:mitochondrial ATPase complex subunit ATP10
MHPDSISRTILPGNFVKKTNRRSGVTRKRYTELVHGYFWMLRDLQQSDEKPVLSNAELIPEADAKVFPALPNLRRLDSNETVDLPSYFLRKNRSRDAAAQCTVVGVSFRDYGYQLLKTWLDPLPAALSNAEVGSSVPSPNRVEVVRLSINEGWVNSWVLRGLIRTLARRNTPTEEQAETLLYFGKDLELFRDALRMHNIMTGYVFLLDGLGRVRFAGSGRASDEEVARLLRFASDLTRQPRSSPQKNRRGKQR